MDSVCSQLNRRFAAVTKFEFFQLLCGDKYSEYRNKFPAELLTALRDIYGNRFDYSRLKSELEVLYTLEEFSHKSIFSLYQHMYDNSLDAAFKEVFQLSQLILSIPSNTASAERSFSALKRINSCLRSSQGQKRLSFLSILSIEKKLLIELQKKPDFHDNVIQKFLAQKRRIDFCYK